MEANQRQRWQDVCTQGENTPLHTKTQLSATLRQRNVFFKAVFISLKYRHSLVKIKISTSAGKMDLKKTTC